jgi:hypothetical protein
MIIMQRILLAIGALTVSAGLAHADPYAAMYGNSVAITGSDGMKSTVYINQDMSWEQHNSDGSVVKGTYAWKDDQTACFTAVTPPPKDASKATTCFGSQSAHQVGDTWTMNGSDGKPATLSITAGR